MKSFFSIAVLAIILSACNQESNIKEINVQDFGIEANSRVSITAAINELIHGLGDDPVVISFPKGRYDFYPDSSYFRNYFESNTYDINPKRLAILLDQKKNITIDGQGSDFIFHGHIQPFTLDNSENISIMNINIDWDYPLSAEGEILEADKNHILVKIDTSQFPYRITDNGIQFAAEGWEAGWRLSGGSFLIEFNKNHIIPAFTGDHGTVRGDFSNVVYSNVKPGLLLMQGEFTKLPGIGSHWIMRHSSRDHAGMFIFHSKDVKLENINVYHTSGLGILSQYSENLDFQNVNMIPNPEKNRYLSGHDDGLHFMGCRGDIIINECDAQGLMDDPINIHGTYVPVKERLNDSTLLCSYAHSMSMGLLWAEQGDKIRFVDKETMNPQGSGIVKSFTQTDENGFTLIFEDKIPEAVSAEYSVENLSWTPNATITNCFVGSNRARGYLISTPGKVVVENNVFETSGSAILIAGDANYWYESGPIRDLSILNNEFRTPCNSSSYQFCHAIISIFPEIPNADPESPYHRNIRIEGNSFNPADYPLLHAKSVVGLSFKRNTITRSYDYEAWHPIKYSFHIEGCKKVEISDNEFGDDVLGMNILMKSMDRSELELGNTELKIEEE